MVVVGGRQYRRGSLVVEGVLSQENDASQFCGLCLLVEFALAGKYAL